MLRPYVDNDQNPMDVIGHDLKGIQLNLFEMMRNPVPSIADNMPKSIQFHNGQTMKAKST